MGELDATLDAMQRDAATDEAPAVPRLTYYLAADLARDPSLMSPPDPILAPLFYRGRTVLLAGREKVGKSTFIGSVIAAVTTGGYFLGERATVGLVLYYALDESLPDTLRRLAGLGADLSRVMICTEAPTGGEVAAKLREWTAALVVVDTLNELVGYSDLKDAAVVLPKLRPILEAIRTADAAGAVLGHASKGTGQYLGAVQIGGAVDATFTLRHYRTSATMGEPPSDDDDSGEADDGRRVLEGKTRWQGTLRLRLTHDGTEYRLGAAPAPLAVRILRQIADGELNRTEVVARIGGRNVDVRRELELLIASGAVRDGGKGAPLTLTDAGRNRLDGGEANRPAYRPAPSTSTPSGRFPDSTRKVADDGGRPRDDGGTDAFASTVPTAHPSVARRDDTAAADDFGAVDDAA